MDKLSIANLPTKIQKTERILKDSKTNLYIKRDDFTGMEISGNKIRKLEYVIKDALNKNCDTLITTGAIQSNHCRATAAAAIKFGLNCELVIRGDVPKEIEGNLFMDYILGANIHIISNEESREEKMIEIKEKLELKGHKPYLIPVGASNSIGSYGYANCFEEILIQEKDLGIKFDSIVVTVGSGGTYAGLWYGNYINKSKKRIYGISVSDSEEKFKKDIISILKNMKDMNADDEYLSENIFINDKYIGNGYALSINEEIRFLIEVAKKEGIIFDPCYTGKAFRAICKEIENGAFEDDKNILFIHTGGIFGWTSNQRKMAMDLINTNKF